MLSHPGEAPTVRSLGVNQMHVRTGSSKLNPPHKKASVDKSRSASSKDKLAEPSNQAAIDQNAVAEVGLNSRVPTVKKANNQP